MPWSASDYPKAMTNLSPKERTQAISIANAILKDGGDEGMAIATGIARAKEAAKGNKPSQGSTDSITAAFYEEVLSSHQETPDMATKKADIGTPIDDPNATPKMAEPGDDIVAPEGTDTPGDPREELEAELSNEATVQAVIEFLQEEGLTIDDVTVSEGIWGWSEASDCATVDLGRKDYMVFPDEDTAERFAEALLRDQIDESPGNYITAENAWDCIDEDGLREFLLSDEEEQVRENPESYGWGGGKWTVKLTGPNGEEETLEETFDTEDEAIDAGYDAQQERGEGWDYDPEQQSDDDGPDDDWVEQKAREVLADPVEWLKDIFGDEAMAKIVEWGYVNVDEFVEKVIREDGWQPQVGSYDGNSHDLPSGGVWVRHN